VKRIFFLFLSVACLSGLLTACAPPAAVPTSSNLTLELRRLQSRVDNQQQAIADLSGKVDALANQLRSQSIDISRIQRPSGAASAAAGQTTPSAPAVGTTPAAAAGSLTTVADGSPTEVYLQAFGNYASGRYQAAIQGFEAFLQRYPNNSYAGNARFWLGDCYFNQQQYATAVDQFNRVLSDYPNTPKAPDALLKIATAQLQLGLQDEARGSLDALNLRYPKSAAAKKAQELVIP
jgi:tol-pal system protein YbgF